MVQENLSDHSESQSGGPRRTSGNSRIADRLLLAASLVGLFTVVFAAAHFPAIHSAWAGLVNKPRTLTPGPDPSARKTAIAPPLENGSAPAMTPQRATLPAEEQAQKIWTDFEKATLGTALDAWTKQRPEIPCHQFNGTMWSPTADAAWLERCSPGPQPEDAHWYFYAFGMDDPPATRLEQFDESTASLPVESLTAVHGMLKSRLAERFGPGEDTSPKTGQRRDLIPPPNYRWQTPELEIQLFESERDPRNNFGRLRLQVRGRRQIEALKEDEHLNQFAGGSFPYQAGSGIDMQLSEKLKGEFPGPAQMLMKERPDADPQKVAQALEQWKQQFRASQAAGQTGVRAAVIAIPQSNWNAAEFEDSIVRLLTAAKSAPPEHQPILLLSADRLAGRLPQVVQNDKSEPGHWAEWRSQLEKLGVTFDRSGQDPGGESWIYTGSVLLGHLKVAATGNLLTHGLGSRFVDDHLTGFHYPTHVLDGYLNVGERIAFDGDEIGEVAGGDGAEVCGMAEEFGGVDGGGAQGLFGSHSGFDEPG